MQGPGWIDEAMAPLWRDDRLRRHLTTAEYNRIWEAVSRGTPEQGGALVEAIRGALVRAQTGKEG